jgi:hypothetical protein
MFQGFSLLSDRMQKLFMTTLIANDELSYDDDDGLPHACSCSDCEMFQIPNTDVYVCKETGRVHECGELCTSQPNASADSNSLVCPISGLVRNLVAKLVSTGAYTADYDNSVRSGGSGVARKRRVTDTAWAERDEKTGLRTGSRIYYIGKRMIRGKRAPSLMTAEGEREIQVACQTILQELYLGKTRRKLMEEAEPHSHEDLKEIQSSPGWKVFPMVAQYVRLLCIHSELFQSFHDKLDSTALCLVVLYTWLTGDGINRLPVAVYKPPVGCILTARLPPRPLLSTFAFGSGYSVSKELFRNTDKFLQEVVTYWNQFALRANRSDLSNGWIPASVKLAIEKRLSTSASAAK